MSLRPTVQRLEAAIDPALCAHCPTCGALVCAPGYWCDDCGQCAFPTMLLDSDYEDEPLEDQGDDEPDDDFG